jgi:hypothetical protein
MSKTWKTAAALLVAVLAFGTMAEAVPARVLRHRARHSTRVSAGASNATSTRRVRKPARKRVRTHRAASAQHRRVGPTTKPR